MFYSNFDLMVPPGSSTATQTRRAPKDLQLLAATGHMHSRGQDFDALVDEQTVYHTDNWSEPGGVYFAPPRPVRAGAPIRWSCAYDNLTSQTFKFGGSAMANEMCIFVALF